MRGVSGRAFTGIAQGATSLLSTVRSAPPVAGSNAEIIQAGIGSAHVPARFLHGYASTSSPIQYPDDPVTTETINVSNQTQLDNAIASGNGKKIIVAAGSYTSLSILVNRSDMHFVLHNSAVFTDGCVIGHSFGTVITRIRIEGGRFKTASSGEALFVISDSSHLMFYNVRFDDGMLLGNFFTFAQHHVAIINCSATSPDEANYGLFWTGTEHLIVARCNIAQTGGQFVAGIRGFGRYAMFANDRVYSNNNRIFRLHADASGDTDLILCTGEQWEAEGGGYNIWIGPEVGVDHSNSIYRVELHFIKYYNENGGISGSVAQTDSTTNSPGIEDLIVDDSEFNSPDSAPFSGNLPAVYSSARCTYPAYTTPPAYSGGADH